MSHRCPLCASAETHVFLTRRGMPAHQNSPTGSADDARSMKRGDLTMTVCHKCGFVFNSTFDTSLMSYGESYENTQTSSAEFSAYVDGLVSELLEKLRGRTATVVEIGCGKGDFIRRLVGRSDGSIRAYGFDPTYEGPLEDCGGRLSFERRFYDEAAASIAADAVICRHVIEHLADPLALLRSTRLAVARSSRPSVWFETPDVSWILKNHVIWDFFYEHCSLFSPTTVRAALELAGFAVNRVSSVFGGQYLWSEAQPAHQAIEPVFAPEEAPALAEEFGQLERRLVAHWRAELRSMKEAHSGIGVWGAGAKGVTFVNMIDPGGTLVKALVDVNPRKQGRFVPGTGHAIIAPERIAQEGLSALVVLNPNYAGEIAAYVAKNNLSARVVNVMAKARGDDDGERHE